MFILKVTTSFSSAHQLRGYKGNCANMHGHCWKVTARISVAQLDSIGLGYDFREIKDRLNRVVGQFDHKFINEIPPFNTLNPTSENLAKYFYDTLDETMPDKVKVVSIEVEESENCSVIYVED
ncbi:6-carboxytetrahydropterin synthase QueD [candidate division KSB1 bacterium]|nr:6-carboxytetrahydropterin synthase QueD [candidate division KSB1 bacterium]